MKRLSVWIVVCLVFSSPLAVHAFAPKKGDKACIECHKLDKKEAEVLVKKIVPTGTVTEVKISPIKGVWQIEVDAGEGKHGSLYLDFSKKFLVAGQLVPVESIGKPAPPRKVDVSKITLDDSVLVGSKDAAKKVIVFSDPDCPYCRELHKSIKQVITRRSDIAFVIVPVALPMHKEAPKKVQAILCSKSAEILDDAFAGKPVPEPAAVCTMEGLERNSALAKTMDFSGTPTMVRDDGMVHSGSMPDDKLIEWIDKKQ